MPKNFSSDLRASVDIFFNATPWCPMMMPFCESRSTYITACMSMCLSVSLNDSTFTSTEYGISLS